MTTPIRSKRGNGQGAGGGRGGGTGVPPHPIAHAIEQLYAAGMTPRLFIDARRADVVIPDFVRAKWAERLVIDLKASDPLDLEYDANGLHATLAFSGYVVRCSFAYASIYAILDRATGNGIPIPAHQPMPDLPPELAHASFEPRPVTEVVESKDGKPPPKLAPALAAVRGGAAVLAQVEPEHREPPPSLEAVPPAKSEAAESRADGAAVEKVSDAEAKARRAKFRVIDGG